MRSVIKDVVFSKNAPGVISIGAVLALWSGPAVFGSVMSTLNSAYNVTETRPWWTRLLIQLASVFGLGLLTGVASVVMLAGPELARGIGVRVGLDHYFVLAWTILQYPLAIGMIVLAFFLVYRYLRTSGSIGDRYSSAPLPERCSGCWSLFCSASTSPTSRRTTRRTARSAA